MIPGYRSIQPYIRTTTSTNIAKVAAVEVSSFFRNPATFYVLGGHAAPPPSGLQRYTDSLMDAADRAPMVMTLKPSVAIYVHCNRRPLGLSGRVKHRRAENQNGPTCRFIPEWRGTIRPFQNGESSGFQCQVQCQGNHERPSLCLVLGTWVAPARSAKLGSESGMDEGMDVGHGRGWCGLELCCACACACAGVCACTCACACACACACVGASVCACGCCCCCCSCCCCC